MFSIPYCHTYTAPSAEAPVGFWWWRHDVTGGDDGTMRVRGGARLLGGGGGWGGGAGGGACALVGWAEGGATELSVSECGAANPVIPAHTHHLPRLHANATRGRALQGEHQQRDLINGHAPQHPEQ